MAPEACSTKCCGLEMPAEILTNIFKYSLGNTVSADPTRLAISLVCKAWHRVLYENPSLWSRISIVFGEGPDLQDTTPDWSFLKQALDLAHPHPIDVAVRIARRQNTYTDEEQTAITRIIIMLRMHVIHWRSIVLQLPDELMGAVWLSACFETATSLRLQRVVLRNLTQCEHHYEEEGRCPITFSPQLRHLEVNFHLMALSPHWANLQSLCIGFRYPLEAKTILKQTKDLTTLVITHVGPPKPGDTDPTFVLDSVLDLSMSNCALLELHKALRCPRLLTFAFFGAYEERRHTDHCSPRTQTGQPNCPASIHSPSETEVARSIDLLRASQAHITTLDITDMLLHIPLLLPLFKYLQSDLHTLIVSDGFANDEFFRAFTDTDIVPQISSFVIKTDRDDVLFCPFIEEAVIARYQAGVLRWVRIEFGSEPDYLTDDCKIQEVYATSSLAKTLVKYRRKGLNAEWIAGKYDILELARERMVMRF